MFILEGYVGRVSRISSLATVAPSTPSTHRGTIPTPVRVKDIRGGWGLKKPGPVGLTDG